VRARAVERSLANIAFSGDAIMTDGDALCAALASAPTSQSHAGAGLTVLRGQMACSSRSWHQARLKARP
jgi:hypothetical protein